MLHFADFRFDLQNRVLYKDNGPVTLTDRQSRLLALLLSSPEQIFSKEDILAQVWSDRVVSEQVVFQNISQLRGIIADNCIKTFPKRGYQWQLPLDELATSSVESVELESTAHQQSDKLKRFLPLGVAILVIALAVFTFKSLQRNDIAVTQSIETTKQSLRAIRLVPIATRYDGNLIDDVEDFNQIVSKQLTLMSDDLGEEQAKKSVEAADFFNSPFMVRKAADFPRDTLVTSGYLYMRRDEAGMPYLILEYLVQGEQRLWQGYIKSKNNQELSDKFLGKLQMLSESNFFSLTADAFTTSELSLLHGQMPRDLDILKHLIERLLIEDQHQSADARIDQMLQLSSEQEHPIYQAYAQWLRGRLLYILNQYELALPQLEAANSSMEKANFLALQSEINKSMADVALQLKDFQLIRQYLYAAASHARLANRPVQEIRAYTLLSIKSAKLGLDKEKYDYLVKAKSLLADYKLDNSHYMLIFYHFALFAETPEEKERFYLELLKMDVTPANNWVFFSASEQLADLYAEQGKWSEASLLAEQITEPARQAYMRTKLALAQGNEQQAKDYALTSFNAARTQHIDWIGLEMALVLLELKGEQIDDSDTLLYTTYIQNNASDWWRERNIERMKKAGVELDPYLQNRTVQ